MNATHQAAHRQIEARRAKLPFVIAIRIKRHDFVRVTGMTQDMRDGTVYRCAATAPLEMERTRVADTRQHEPVPNLGEL